MPGALARAKGARMTYKVKKSLEADGEGVSLT